MFQWVIFIAVLREGFTIQRMCMNQNTVFRLCTLQLVRRQADLIVLLMNQSEAS